MKSSYNTTFYIPNNTLQSRLTISYPSSCVRNRDHFAFHTKIQIPNRMVKGQSGATEDMLHKAPKWSIVVYYEVGLLNSSSVGWCFFSISSSSQESIGCSWWCCCCYFVQLHAREIDTPCLKVSVWIPGHIYNLGEGKPHLPLRLSVCLSVCLSDSYHQWHVPND